MSTKKIDAFNDAWEGNAWMDLMVSDNYMVGGYVGGLMEGDHGPVAAMMNYPRPHQHLMGLTAIGVPLSKVVAWHIRKAPDE